MQRPEGLKYRDSLRAALGDADEARIEALARRQERTVDALLGRMYAANAESKREMTLLADEVGLGKTFVALGVAWSVLMQRQKVGLAAGPALVVTPHAHALYSKWHREAEKFNNLVAPAHQQFEVVGAEAPNDLATRLCPSQEGRLRLVIARMPALSGRLTLRDTADLAVLHWLLRQPDLELDLDARVLLVSGKPDFATRDDLDLRRSGQIWQAAADSPLLGFTEDHIADAWERFRLTDRDLRTRIAGYFATARRGERPGGRFWDDLREVGRTALGQRIRHALPIVIVDEIHNWKNEPQSWWRFHHMLGGRIDRMLGLSATPFQLGPHELIQVLKLRRCLRLSSDRRRFLDTRVSALERDLQVAGAAGARLRDAWSEVSSKDDVALTTAWLQDGEGGALPPRLRSAVTAARAVKSAHESLMSSLRPFLVRHRRDVSHRVLWVGRDSAPGCATPEDQAAGLSWRPGLDIDGDAEIVHYLMMRAAQEASDGRGAPTLGADLGGSYEFFRESVLKELLPGRTPAASAYLRLVDEATGEATGHEHPKVAVTAERAFQAWLRGEKTLVFCFNVKTTEALQSAIRGRVERYGDMVLSGALRCAVEAVPQRLKNLQSRLYNYRQALFLLFQDHPLAGPMGYLADSLSLTTLDLSEIASRLSLNGPPDERGRFNRRLVLVCAEQHLVKRWRGTAEGRAWLDGIARTWRMGSDADALADIVLAPEWGARRRRDVEGLRGEEMEALPDDQDVEIAQTQVDAAPAAAWRAVLESRAGRAVLAPYLAGEAGPSLLSTFHSTSMAALPFDLRAVAVKMLRRLVRSKGFLVRFLLSDPAIHPAIEDDGDEADRRWTRMLHDRWAAPPAGGESARDRFEAYLDSLRKATGLDLQIKAYEDATRNHLVAARVTGAVASAERDRLFTGFNTPLMPEVLIVTTVGQEGIDLHRECRHVIHHDLPWNPATLEQRTGRVDRIASKAERLQRTGIGGLDVVVPYIAGTYDEHRFRVVQGRAHVFEVTMGAEYAVDGHRPVVDAMDKSAEDDLGLAGATWAALPPAMASDLRLRLEAE